VPAEAIILAGGLGTRLRSVVSELPKSMAPVAGQPFLAYLLHFLETQGVRRVVLAVGYRKESICEFFGSRFGGLAVDYSIEDEPLGTGGAIRQAVNFAREAQLFVLNGDTFLRLDYAQFAAAAQRHPSVPLTVALRRVPDTSRYGAVLLSGGRIRGFTARGDAGPGLINGGCYVVHRDIFDRYPMPQKFSWEKDFLEARAEEIQPIAFECDAEFIDIGVPEALEQAQSVIPEWAGV